MPKDAGQDARESAKARCNALVRAHGEKAKALVRRLLGKELRQRVDSDDVLQESLLEASKLFLEGRGAEGSEGGDFLRWLRQIIENKVRNLRRIHVEAARRSVRREEALDRAPGAEGLRARQETPSAEVARLEASARVRRAVEKLSPREREVVTLVHFDKLRLAEAARRLGKTPGSTSVLLHGALQKLKAILKRREV